VYELLKENIHLNVRVGEAELRAKSGRCDAPGENGALLQPERRAGTNSETSFGVNLAGFFGSEKGLGEAVRSTARSLDAADIPYSLNNHVDHGSFNEDDTYTKFTTGNTYPINLTQVNVDSIETFYQERGKTYFEGRHNIGYWVWELSDFPEEWEPNFRHFDEIWVPSNFSLESVSRAAPIPVVRIPYAIDEQPEIGPGDRSRFDLPENKFLYLFIFDFHSSLERKNPLGLVEAFARAFPTGGDATLVLKCAHSGDCPGDRAALAAAAERADVRIIDRVMSRREVNRLLALADCYVSLHRSEGFGLTLAEAMALGKPVVATAYSGNMDFMTPANSFLVSYELTKIEQDHGLYKKGYIWADPDRDHAAELLRHVFQNSHVARAVGRVARHDILRRFHPRVVGALIKHRLQKVAAPWGALPTYSSPPESPCSDRCANGRSYPPSNNRPALLSGEAD
jgi:glycosyltransferase involved in cell wall biosynthesis